nr:hypothetical protein [Saprospiraceae bacterium]
MKARFLGMAMAWLVGNSLLQGQILGKVDSGAIDGVGYRIVFPEKWQHKLVMYAHGYEAEGTPIRQSQNPYWTQSMSLFVERGFAVAASDY